MPLVEAGRGICRIPRSSSSGTNSPGAEMPMTSPNSIAASSWGKTRYRRLKSTVVRWATFTSNPWIPGYWQTSSAGTRTDSLLRRSYDEGRGNPRDLAHGR